MFVWSGNPNHVAHIANDKLGGTMCSIEGNDKLSDNHPLVNYGEKLPVDKKVCLICLSNKNKSYNAIFGNKPQVKHKIYVKRLNKYTYV